MTESADAALRDWYKELADVRRSAAVLRDGAMRFLDFWASDVEKASSPKEQGQIVRFLGDVRKHFGGG